MATELSIPSGSSSTSSCTTVARDAETNEALEISDDSRHVVLDFVLHAFSK